VRYKLFLLLVTLVSTNLNAKAVTDNFSVDATTYSDGILLIANDSYNGLQLTIGGPGNKIFKQSYPPSDAAFLDINDIAGQKLPDGLYKYEIYPIPAVTYTREESSRMPGRNDVDFGSGPTVSPVSGSFRVVNGEIADSELQEFDASAFGGTVE
jgi:hypothetical protein